MSSINIFFFIETILANAQIPSNAGQFQYDCIAVNLTARLVIPVDRGIFIKSLRVIQFLKVKFDLSIFRAAF